MIGCRYQLLVGGQPNVGVHVGVAIFEFENNRIMRPGTNREARQTRMFSSGF